LDKEENHFNCQILLDVTELKSVFNRNKCFTK
jgi:hypothetical protein